jgi:holo-[acyl-carrier protein] synthase
VDWRPAVGIDVVRVTIVTESINRFGDRYLQRLYTSAEIEYAQRSPAECSRRLAARFAAKEATLKVLRPESRWLDWRLIEIERNAHGHCSIALHGEADRLRQQRRISALSVSLSHEGDVAVAAVMGLCRA